MFSIFLVTETISFNLENQRRSTLLALDMWVEERYDEELIPVSGQRLSFVAL